MLSDLPVPTDPRVLVDYRTADDAGVYRLSDDTALVQTVDFFTPVVDDPYAFGQIAAANALSDVYAMGGRPLTALAIAAFPVRDFDRADIVAVFRGGLDKLTEAGVPLLGGHTVQDAEVKFGYAVTGIVHPGRLLANAGAQPGDVLVLTKPIGTGVISTAIKHDRAPADVTEAAVRMMARLNRAAAQALLAVPPDAVHACTDVTGFGLVGHATEVAVASGLTLHLDVAAVPLLEGALDLARTNRPGGGATNLAHFAPQVREPAAFNDCLRALMYDPQTSGGLLVAVAPSSVGLVLGALGERGEAGVVIGEAAAPEPGVRIVLR